MEEHDREEMMREKKMRELKWTRVCPLIKERH